MELRKRKCCSLVRPIAALQLSGGGARVRKAVVAKIEAGEIFEIEGPAPELDGMIKVTQQGKSYAVFAQDLQDRAVEMKPDSRP
jgi:hypothetical protein